MGRWVKLWVTTVAALLVLDGCVMPPGRYGYSGSIMVGAPQVAFTFDDGVAAYYESAYGVYVYEDDGVYYRWTDGAWVYANNYDGPWAPVLGAVYLPPLLMYGPPPPLVRYRPYFLWWRGHFAHWYAIHHPRWWYRHRVYMRSYPAWRAHVVKGYARHPGRRPGMRAFYHPREQRLDRRGPPLGVMRRPEDRHPEARRPAPPVYRPPFVHRPRPFVHRPRPFVHRHGPDRRDHGVRGH